MAIARGEFPPQPGTKQALLIEMLRGEGGAGIQDLAQVLGWRRNGVHAAITTLRKRGYSIVVERTETGYRYRMT
jgi:biotin operon repressor